MNGISMFEKKKHITLNLEFWVILIGWLVGFYDILTFVGYLMTNPFLYKSTVQFEIIRLAYKYTI